MKYATLKNEEDFTVFSFDNKVIRFKSPYSLQFYSEVKEWDNGYIVVMTKYKHTEELIEEYIDLEPILENLYIDREEILKPIEEVRVQYD